MADQTPLFTGAPVHKSKVRIEQSGNDYAVITPFNAKFVAELKVSIPPGARSWDGEKRAWIVTQPFAEMAAQIVQEFYGEKPEIPELVKVEVETKYSFQLDYVGIPKERDGQAGKTALGFSKGQWRIVFDEDTLKGWFEQCQTERDLPATLFSVLLVSESASILEIKSAYRRLARQWHPDVCKEENGEAMFKKINEAYKVLSEPLLYKKYLAGLYLERSSKQERPRRDYYSDTFIPPLRCGFLTVTGNVQVGRLKVSQILKWEDVQDEQGLTMVTSWNRELNAIDYQWV